MILYKANSIKYAWKSSTKNLVHAQKSFPKLLLVETEKTINSKIGLWKKISAVILNTKANYKNLFLEDNPWLSKLSIREQFKHNDAKGRKRKFCRFTKDL